MAEESENLIKQPLYGCDICFLILGREQALDHAQEKGHKVKKLEDPIHDAPEKDVAEQ